MNFFIQKLNKAFYPIEKEEKKTIFVILILTLLSSFTELLSIGLIIPILNLFVESGFEKYFHHFNFFNLENKNEILIFILGILAIAHFGKFFFSRALIKLQNKFPHDLNCKLSKRLFYEYLNKDYKFFLDKNSSELIRNIFTELNIFSFGVIYHIIRLVSEFIILLSLTILLFIYNFEVTLSIIIFFTILGFYFYQSTGVQLSQWGKERQVYSLKILKQLNESFASFRELVLNKLQNTFFNNLSYFIEKNADVGAKKEITLQMPRIILEFFTIIILILIVCYLLLVQNYEIKEIFVVLGVFFYAAVRILPATSKIILSIQSLKNNSIVVETIYDQLKVTRKKKFNLDSNYERYEFNKIKFNNLKFFYENKKIVFENLNFEINKNEKIGLMGKSGSGKSTFINLFSGLLKPSQGSIEIDEKQISDTLLEKFQSQITYVPQKVTIFDESVFFNISLETDIKKVNIEKLNIILKELDLHKTIYNLPENINQRVGEKGSKLSGGQCQRIGIARALYRDKDIIVLDEATNSLDVETEKKILDILFNKYKEKTIIFSTHKFNSLKYCDTIYEIDDYDLKKRQ